jgi:hypothetical protein
MSTDDPDQLAPGDEVAPDTKAAGPNVCPECGGTGRVGPERCTFCEGSGHVEEAVGGG